MHVKKDFNKINQIRRDRNNSFMEQQHIFINTVPQQKNINMKMLF